MGRAQELQTLRAGSAQDPAAVAAQRRTPGLAGAGGAQDGGGDGGTPTHSRSSPAAPAPGPAAAALAGGGPLAPLGSVEAAMAAKEARIVQLRDALVHVQAEKSALLVEAALLRQQLSASAAQLPGRGGGGAAAAARHLVQSVNRVLGSAALEGWLASEEALQRQEEAPGGAAGGEGAGDGRAGGGVWGQVTDLLVDACQARFRQQVN